MEKAMRFTGILITLIILSAMNYEHLSAQVFDQIYPDFPANEMSDLVRWNGDTLFACGFNWTLQRSTDAGATWEEMLDGYPKYNLVRMGSDGNYLYFLPIPTGFTQKEMENDTRVLLLRYDPRTDSVTKLYTDRIPAGLPVFIKMRLSVGQSIIALLQVYHDTARLVRSTDAGSNWVEVQLPREYYENENSTIEHLRFRDPLHGTVSIKTESGGGYNVYLTKDAGKTWTQVENVRQQFVEYARTPPEPGGWFGDSLVILVHERRTPVISMNRGASWQWCTPVNAFIMTISFDESGTGYFADVREEIWKTTDFGISWVKCREGFDLEMSGENLGCMVQIGADTLVTMDIYGNIWRTMDGGISWDATRMSDVWYFKNLQFVNEMLGYVIANDRLDGRRRYLRTTDGGMTWADHGDFPVAGKTPLFFHLDEQHAFALRSFGYQSSEDTLIFRSTTGGSHWEPVYFWSNDDSININLLVQGRWFCSRDTGYVPVNGNRLLRTTDGGDSWTLLAGPASVIGTENDMRLEWMDARNSPTVWFAATREILRSEDAGETWISVLSLPDSIPDNDGFTKVQILDSGGIFVIAMLHLYYSSDGGASWEDWEPGTLYTTGNTTQFTKQEGIKIRTAQSLYEYGGNSNVYGTSDAWKTQDLQWSFGNHRVNNFSYVYFLDRMRGWIYGMTAIYRTTNGGINWTNITPTIPQTPRIVSTWPQPVMQGRVMSTEIELTRPGPVNIELFDLLGRRRAVVLDTQVDATRRIVQYSTAGLERGVYVLRMVTGSGIANAKVVVE